MVMDHLKAVDSSAQLHVLYRNTATQTLTTVKKKHKKLTYVYTNRLVNLFTCKNCTI